MALRVGYTSEPSSRIPDSTGSSSAAAAIVDVLEAGARTSTTCSLCVFPDLVRGALRNPDSTEHQFGPGSANYLDALRDQDALLGQLQRKLVELGLHDSCVLIVVSDHGHSTVAGDAAVFPLRALSGNPDGHGEVGAPDAGGYSLSGEVRPRMV